MMGPECSALPLILVMIPWLLADTSRYAFYLIKNSSLVGALRYNLFIVLYPLGIQL